MATITPPAVAWAAGGWLWHGVGVTSRPPSRPTSGDGFIRCSDGHVRWGRYGAAGVVFVAVDGVARVLMQLRSAWSHEGGTWSCPGGALHLDESPVDGALREATEEIGAPPAGTQLIGQHVFAPATDWTYTTVVVQVDAPFGAALNFETETVEWLTVGEVDRRAMHPGFASAWPHVRAIVASAVPG